MQKRGLIQKGFLLTVVLLLLVTVVLSYANQQGTGNVVRRGVLAPSTLYSPSSGPSYALPSCSSFPYLELYRYVIPPTNPAQLPLPLPVIISNSNFPNTLKSYPFVGSTASQLLVFNPSNFVYRFGLNDATRKVASFYVHASESLQPAQFYLQYALNFSPSLSLPFGLNTTPWDFPIPSLISRQLYVLGRPGRIMSATYNFNRNELQLIILFAGRQANTISEWRINFDLSTSGFGSQGLIIDGEVIEDVYTVARGSVQLNSLSLQSLNLYYLADGSPGYQHIDSPAGDFNWQSLVDEPQPLVGLDWSLEFRPTTAVAACTGPGAGIFFWSDFC